MKLDKSKWPPGPWHQEPDDHMFKVDNMPCMMKRNSVGSWCGYVGITKNHPWYGHGYDDIVDIDVHGGLTYARKSNNIIFYERKGEALWWFGFDCAHYNDFSPALYKYGFSRLNNTYRTFEWVKAEVESLARQIKKEIK